MIGRVHHTGFTVSSIAEAMRFWVDALGFRVAGRDFLDRGAFVAEVTGVRDADIDVVMLEGPGHIIELLAFRGVRERRLDPHASDIGAAHVALFADNLEEVLDRVRGCGWGPVGSPQTVPAGPWEGTRVAYIRGPDGIFVELMQPPPAAVPVRPL